MSIFVRDPEELKAEAEEKLVLAESLLGLAVKAYDKDPCRENEISLKAATRLVKETTAQMEEWL